MDLSRRGAPRRLATAIAAALLAACSASADRSAAGNPLATEAQRTLDARLAALHARDDFAVERALLRAQFVAGHGLPLSAEALARLDAAIDELVGGALAEALNGNAARPRVHWLAAAPHRWFGIDVPGTRWAYDNPDNAYRTIPIAPDGRYLVRGRRHGDGPADMSFSLIDDTVTQGTVAYLDGKALATDGDGRYALTIDGDPAGERAAHLRSDAGTVQLFVRSNLGDWAQEEHDTLEVERLDLAPEQAAELDDATIVASASRFLLKSGPVYGLALLGLKTMAAPLNTLPAPSRTQTPGALITQANSFGHFRLGDDEALLISFDPGGAGYWVVPVTDPWMLSVDPGRYSSSLNSRQALADADGRYTFVVAVRDPGVHNWLDTAGLHEGTMMLRWQRLPAGGGHPAVAARLVKLQDLAAALPPGTRRIDADERRRLLAARQAAYARRFRED
ncbi:hypothetical protein [Solimonas flava]|uniref:hypothetical protein n=1 Tax=Solimonas flava TaxID=415849 RepID=UPI000429BFC9|nr:hypothetical protein [Solimonas flava]